MVVRLAWSFSRGAAPGWLAGPLSCGSVSRAACGNGVGVSAWLGEGKAPSPEAVGTLTEAEGSSCGATPGGGGGTSAGRTSTSQPFGVLLNPSGLIARTVT